MTPEQKARVSIDALLTQAGWHVCDMAHANIHAARGVALREFPPGNLKCMRAFATAWPDRELVQRTVAQLSWGQNIVLLEELTHDDDRLWYAARTLESG